MKTLVSVSMFVLSMVLVVPAFAKPPTNNSAIVGVWANTNHASRGIVRIVVRNTPTGVTIQPYGACTPRPCDHGVLMASTFSPGVASAMASGFNAMHDFGFKATSYNGFMQGRMMMLMTQDTFAAADSRFNYTMMETFRRTRVAAPMADDATSVDLLDHASQMDLE